MNTLKTFLYILSSFRLGKKDGVLIAGGTHYHHEQLLAVIDAETVEDAVSTMGLNITNTFDRSGVGLPTVYYTSPLPIKKDPNEYVRTKEGSFYLFLKEIEQGDFEKYDNLPERIYFKVTAENNK